MLLPEYVGQYWCCHPWPYQAQMRLGLFSGSQYHGALNYSLLDP